MTQILYSKNFEIKPSRPDLGLYESLYSLKRDLILFDKVVFPNLHNFCVNLYSKEKSNYSFETQLIVKELQNLIENKLIIDYKLYDKSPDLFKDLLSSLNSKDELLTSTLMSIAHEHLINLIDLQENKRKYIKEFKSEEEYDRIYWQLYDTREKLESIIVTKLISFEESLDIIDSFPVREGQIISVTNAEGKKTMIPQKKENVNIHNAYCFVLNELPFPSDSTPWEAILDYRLDPDYRLRLSRLRMWLSKVLNENYTEKELQQEYEHFYLEFETAMKYFKIKNNRTGLKIFLTTVPEFLEDAIKLRFGKITKNIYNSSVSASLERVQLFEAESNAQGKEVAYNFFSHEKFKS